MDRKLIGYPQLAALAALEENWDSYGARPIDPRCIEYALFFIQTMPPGTWTPVPCSDGSIQLERHAGGMDLELSISVAVSASPSQNDVG